MPGFDKTGPSGDGPMSGKAQGMCRPARIGRQQEQPDGYGQGRGRRQGRTFQCGRRNRFGCQGGPGFNRPQPSRGEVND